MTMMTSLRARLEKRAKYRRTVNELSALSEADMRDLNIARVDVPRIAYQAVYG